MKNGRTDGSRRASARAMARPGYRWPPVPPPANHTIMARSRRDDRVRIGRGVDHDALAHTANVHQQAGEEHRQNQIRSTVGDERQGQPGRWEKADDDTEMEKGGHGHRKRQANRDQLEELVARVARNLDTEPGPGPECRHDEEHTHESPLFTDGAANEIVVRERDESALLVTMTIS